MRNKKGALKEVLENYHFQEEKGDDTLSFSDEKKEKKEEFNSSSNKKAKEVTTVNKQKKTGGKKMKNKAIINSFTINIIVFEASKPLAKKKKKKKKKSTDTTNTTNTTNIEMRPYYENDRFYQIGDKRIYKDSLNI